MLSRQTASQKGEISFSGKDVIMHFEELIITFLLRKLDIIESLTWTDPCISGSEVPTDFITKSGLTPTNSLQNS